ncbi:MAG: zinc ribbon domain-containing protein [Nitrospinae bacterium]|nr:zinc ribbon domain-containing protein [Nitrospinota bacterium]
MPIFEYECSQRHRFEKLERGKSPKSRACPTCGRRAHRILSPVGFILKGEGFYVNDYPSASRKAAMKAEKGGGEDAPSSSDAPSGSSSAED